MATTMRLELIKGSSVTLNNLNKAVSMIAERTSGSLSAGIIIIIII